jgi:gamma-glutamylcyclotransferase (GGCT)/AIG2-like uncharacterized protein YtfP
VRLFLYGTLMDPAVAQRVAGEDRFVQEARPALLPGWRRVMLRGTPYPTLVRDASAAVHGLLAEVPPAVLQRLHAYEGPLYCFVRVHVFCDGATIAARAWIAPPARAAVSRLRPFRSPSRTSLPAPDYALPHRGP